MAGGSGIVRAEPGGSDGSGPAAVDDPTIHRHFVMQAERPGHLAEVELAEMEPLLRGLLFTDGTVTRALEAGTLSRVSVDVIDQVEARLAGSAAAHLQVGEGASAVRRRVAIGADALPAPLIWAESHILPGRLPNDFLSVLEGAPDGIGESLQQVKLESWRDLLWFGLERPPQWSEAVADGSRQAITRRYRVITGARPVLLISESFAVERERGAYRLGWFD